MANPDYDTYVLEKSLVQEDTPFIFKNKKFVTITDSNNLSYNGGQVQFDLTQIASSSDFLDLKNSYLVLPLELKASAGAGYFAAAAVDSFGLKSGYHHLINSMSVYMSGQEVVSTQQFSNIPIQYKLMTEMSQLDLDTVAPSIGFAKDPASIKFNDAVFGEYQNDLAGLKRRVSNLTNVNDAEVLKYTNESRVIAARKPFVKVNTAQRPTGNNNAMQLEVTEMVHNYMAIIPLAHLHDFFYQCPLVKGSYFRIVLNLNAPCSCTWPNQTPTGDRPTITTTTNMIPFMIDASSGVAGLTVTQVGTNGNLSISLKIGNALQTACELRAQMCEFNPSFAQQYLNSGAKTIKYTDFQTYDNMKDIASGENKQHQLTAGLGRLRKLLLLPFVGTSGNNSIPATSSPYTSCPATCMPYVNLSNFNIQLSGANLYQTNLTYSWQQWLESCASLGGINGNPLAEVGLKSGLISERDWYNGYGFIHVNLSNKDEPQDELPRSVMVQFQNNSQKPISVHATIYYEREITLDPATGQLII